MRMLLSTAGAAIVAGSIALAGLAITDAKADGELNVLTWEGYTDPSFVATFEEQTGCKLTPTYVGSNDEFPAKLAGGGSVYDLVSPSIDTDLDPDEDGRGPGDRRLAHGRLRERLRELPRASRRHRTPTAMSMASPTPGARSRSCTGSTVSRPRRPRSPSCSIRRSPARSACGTTRPISTSPRACCSVRDTDVFNLSDDQLAQVRDKLIEMKPQIRKYWSTAGELVNLYANGEVTVSNTWGGYQSSLLADQGIEMVEFIPTENADGWADSWQLVKGTPNEDCAYKWLNFTLSPEGQCGVVGITGYSGSNPEAAEDVPADEEFAGLHQDDFNYIDSLDLWQDAGRCGRLYRTWNAVKAAQ